MTEKKWYEDFSYDAYKGYKLFKWNGEKFKGSGIKYLTNRFQRTHAKKTTEIDEKAIKAFNLKVELFAQKLFDELVSLDRKVVYGDIFSGNKLSENEKARRDRDSKKRAEDRAKKKKQSEEKKAQDAKAAQKRKEDRLEKKKAAAIELAKSVGLKVQ